MARASDSQNLDPSRIMLGVLDAVEQDRVQSQRHLASELGIALGLANAYLKRCIGKGLVKVRQAPARRYAYYLTPQGFAEKSRLTVEYLSSSFGFFAKRRSIVRMCCRRRRNAASAPSCCSVSRISRKSPRCARWSRA